LKQVRGLDAVLPALLARDLHPTAVAGFLMTAQPDLRIDGQPKSVRDWLLHGVPGRRNGERAADAGGPRPSAVSGEVEDPQRAGEG
ncbi:hypothetical protein BI295_25145, partial [Mycobacterium avium subsp. hominissuis]